jgi:DNA polymerase-4
VEVFSVDEAFIDVTHCQRLHGSPAHIARRMRQHIYGVSGGLSCSIGVAGNKSVAKYASDVKKPNGITVIPPWEARACLREVPVEKICGIGPRIAEFLALYGARTCGDVADLPMTVLGRRYGVVGKYLWQVCQGRDTEPVVQEAPLPRSVGHGKVLPPHTTVARTIEIYLRHMAEKVATRLRRYGLQAGRLYIGLRREAPLDAIEAIVSLSYGPPDGKRFFEHARSLLRRRWRGEAVIQVQITAIHLRHASGQLDLFAPDDGRGIDRFTAVDRINTKYGEFTVAPATLLQRSTMPNVIAPAWRPDGHRQHIPD